ncbi:MAG: cytochrome c [Acidobacteria bacterium]|nr:cytochrome c [Acidobacteriota bacterium]
MITTPLVRSFCTGLLAVGLLFPFGLTLTARQAPRGAKPAAVDAQAIYKQQCMVCHGADGKGTLPGVGSFPEGEWLHGSREQDIAKVIRDGAPGTTMMAFKSRLKPEEIEALARFVRGFDKKLKPEKPASK